MSQTSVGATRYYCHRCRSNTNVFRAPMPACGACHSQFVEEIHYSDHRGDEESDVHRHLESRGAARRMDLMYNNHDDVSNVHLSSSTEGADGLSETLNSTLGFRQRQRQQQQREHERLRANRIVTALSTETASDGEEPVTDDGDEDYEDVEEEEEEEMSEDEDFEHPWQRYYDEPDYSEDEDEHLHPWRRYYRRAVEEEQQTRRRPVPINQMDDYDIDRFNDEVYDYNSRMARDELRHDLEEVDDNYHHHRLHLHHHHAHSHFHQNGVPMIEHVISMLYGVAPDRDGSEHPLSSILNDLLQNQDGSVQRVAASSEEIEKLEKRELKEGDPDVETECIICQDAFGIKTELIKMPCKHEYHGKCIRHWLGVSTTCPMCRSTLPEERPPPSEQQQQQQQTANSDPLGGRTYTFQSPAGTTTVGVWVADPSTLPPNLHYPHHHSHHRHHHPFDDDDEYDGNYNDENDFLDALDHVFDDDDDENDDDPYYDEDEDGEEDDEDEDLLWGLPHHPMMHVCPHGYPRMPPATLRERPAARPAASSATTPRTNQQGSQQQQHAFRQVNPMDELD